MGTLNTFAPKNPEMKLSTNLLIILIPLFVIIGQVSSQAEPKHVNQFCIDDAGRYLTGSTYQDNLKLLISNLTTQASSSLFNNHTVGEGDNKAYGLYMCRGDSSLDHCEACVKAASMKIVSNCTSEKEAIMWYEMCMVRYANRNIFSLEEVWPIVYTWRTMNVSNPLQFSQFLEDKVDELIVEAHSTSNNGFAVGKTNASLFDDLYVLIQCTPDILGDPCDRCLKAALRNIAACCDGLTIKTFMYLPSCWLLYSNIPFYWEPGAPPLSTPPLSPLPPSPPLSTPPLSPLPPSPPLNFQEGEGSDSLHTPPPPQTPLPQGGSSAETITASGISFVFGLMLAVSTFFFTINL